MAKPLNETLSAPDFALKDTNGNTIHLSDYRGKQAVVLVFNRGFI
jgi:peroxiredoxin